MEEHPSFDGHYPLGETSGTLLIHEVPLYSIRYSEYFECFSLSRNSPSPGARDQFLENSLLAMVAIDLSDSRDRSFELSGGA